MQANRDNALPPAHGRGPFAATLLGLVAAACAQGALAQDFIYVVRPGDNPWNITERYLKSIDYWPRIQDYNRILEPTAIQPGTLLRIPVGWMRARQDTARVIDVHGSVEHRRGSTVEPVVAGMELTAGATIHSGDDGSLTIEFADGSRSRVGNNAELRVGQVQRLNASGAQQVGIELKRGQIESVVTPARKAGGRYTIETPAAVAAVRGTDFRVRTDGTAMLAETLEGEIALRNRRGETRLRAGTGTQATRSTAPAPAQRLLSAPALDALPERIERVPFSIDIADVPGATGYRTQIAPSAAFTVVASDRVSAAPAVRGEAHLPDGEYMMRVRAIDARGLEGIDAERSIIIDARPEPPFPSQPAPDGFATEERIGFTWGGIADALQYHFELAGDPGFEHLLQREDLVEPHFVLAHALEAGDYFWRVAVTTASEGRGPFSDPQRFRRPQPGPTPEAPEIDGEHLQLRWRASDGAERYEVQVSSDASFGAPEYTLETERAELVMPRPPGGTWHVRIRSQEAAAPMGPWGTPQQLEVPHNHWRALLILLPLLLAL
ncbi:FecR domain-containing protein [Thauera mechernichensis]